MNLSQISPGARLKEALEKEKPLQVVGTINALMAMLAKRAEYRVIYLSGAGVANASYGLPDLGITTLDNVAEDARRITDVVDLPLLVDIDTGFGATAFSIARTIQTLEKVGVAGVHIEDQEAQKRCGHRPRKKIVSTEEMCNRIQAAVLARKDPDFMIMARTDAFANEGLKGAINRIHQYITAGATAIFPEAFTSLREYKAITDAVSVPVLANITEFGKTPLFSLEELQSAGVSLILYPLTAFRVMNKAAEQVYSILRKQGTQRSMIEKMQTREELYELLDYYRYENILDQLGGKKMPERKIAVGATIDPGLRGINVGTTTICPVGEKGINLSYRGYAIEELARYSTFEEVSYLLINGELPTAEQLSNWIFLIKKNRNLPVSICKILDVFPKHSHLMSILRTAISALGILEPEVSKDSKSQAIRILGFLPSVIGYWEKRGAYDTEIPFDSTESTMAGYLLHMINGDPPTEVNRRTLDKSLILYAEHEYAASTYATRVCASTLADYFSCIATAIGTISGPLNGGANEEAIKLLLSFKDAEEAEGVIRQNLKEKKLIMGFGHAVYADFDPRSVVIKEQAREIASKRVELRNLYNIAEAIERAMWEKKIFPNLDFYTAAVYHMMDINPILFTPIFVVSRSSGWAAHIMEQRNKNKLIRPTAEYIGPKKREYLHISERT